MLGEELFNRKYNFYWLNRRHWLKLVTFYFGDKYTLRTEEINNTNRRVIEIKRKAIADQKGQRRKKTPRQTIFSNM
jgi:hypothetical protein